MFPSARPKATPDFSAISSPQVPALAQATPTPAPTATATATSEPVFSCPGAIASRLEVGDEARVTYSSGQTTRLRSSPSFFGNNIIADINEGTLFDVIGGPACVTSADGETSYIFWEVSIDSLDLTGWMAEGAPWYYFVAPILVLPEYVDCPGAVPINVTVGSAGRVTFTTGEPLRLRLSPRMGTDNVLSLLDEGTMFDVTGGPVCIASDEGDPFVMWQVAVRRSDLEGWLAEGEPGNYFIEHLFPPRKITIWPWLREAYNEVYPVMVDRQMTEAEKQARMRELEEKHGAEILVQVMPYVPIFESRTNRIFSYEAFMQADFP